MYNSQYYTCEQIDQRLLQGYLDDYNTENNTSLTKAQFLAKLGSILGVWQGVDVNPIYNSPNLVESGGVFATTLRSSKHTPTNFSPAKYEAKRYSSIEVHLKEEYRGSTIRIIQSGVLNNTLHTGARVYKDGQYVGRGGKATTYDTLPTTPEFRGYPIKSDNGEIIGVMSFVYSWQGYSELLNAVPANYDTQHIEVSDIYFDFDAYRVNGYLFGGIATPSATPGVLTDKTFFIACEAGTYTNFGNITIPSSLSFLKWDGSSWSVNTLYNVDDEPTDGSKNPVKSGGVFRTSLKSSNITPTNFGPAKYEAKRYSSVEVHLSSKYKGSIIRIVQSGVLNNKLYIGPRCYKDGTYSCTGGGPIAYDTLPTTPERIAVPIKDVADGNIIGVMSFVYSWQGYSELLNAIPDNYDTQHIEIDNVIFDFDYYAELKGYIFGGVATPTTQPGTPINKTFYFACVAGTYTNFGNIVLSQSISLLMWNGTTWSSSVLYNVDNVPTRESASLLKSGGAADMSVMACSHTPTSFSAAQRQNEYVYNVDCHLEKEYEGATVRIVQLGYLGSTQRLYFSCRIYQNSQYISAGGFSVDVSTLPTTDIRYGCALKVNNRAVGSISFFYAWSKGGATGLPLLNAIAENYDTQHIELSNIAYDFGIAKVYEEIDNINSVVGLSNSIITKGYLINFSSLNGAFSGLNVVTIENSFSENAIMLTSLIFGVKVAGKFKIGIGHLDQRSWYLESSSFDVETTETGNVTFDLSDRKIIIPAGDSIFVYTNYYNDETIGFNGGSHATDGFYYGNPNGVVSRFPYGGYCTIQWAGKVFDSFFALKADVERLNTQIEQVSGVANTAYTNNFKAKDRNNNLYKLLVVNGTIQVIPMQFSNVLVIGNSITNHGQTQYYGGWYASGRGMASSVVGNDFCGLLQTGLRSKNQNAVVTRYTNLTSWYRNPTDLSDAKFDELFGDMLENNYDLIVFRLSENNNSHIDLMKNATVACINYIWSKLPNAEAVITSDIMDNNSNKNAQLSAAAIELGITYINAQCAEVRYKYDNNNWQYVPYYYQGDNMSLYPIQEVYHTHPNDLGMLKIANAILGAIGYNTMSKAHAIAVNSQQDYNAWSEGVENGIITVLLYGESAPSTYTVVDANGNNIQATLHDMSNVVYHTAPSRVPTYAITFVMPDSNVTISIS